MQKTVVYEYRTEISHGHQVVIQPEALEALNIYLVGTNNINIVDECGKIVENPAVTQHENYKKLLEAHHRFHAGNTIPVTVRVYSDGSHDIVSL